MTSGDEDRKEPASELSGSWTRFLSEFKAREALLVKRLTDAWNNLSPILSIPAGGEGDKGLSKTSGLGIDDYLELRQAIAKPLLRDSLEHIHRTRPLRAAIMALEAYDRALADRLRDVPQNLVVSGPEALAALETLAPKGLGASVVRWRRKRQPIPMRAALSRGLRRLYSSRSKLENRCLLAISDAMRAMPAEWDLARSALDARVAGSAFPEGDHRRVRARLQQRLGAITNNTSATLSARAQWTDRALSRIAQGLIWSILWRARRPDGREWDPAAATLAHWTAQSRSLETEIRVGLALEACERDLLGLCRQTLASLAQELQSLRGELDSVIEWLKRQLETPQSEPFPAPKADVVPSSSRLSEFDRHLSNCLKALPESYEVLSRLSASPARGRRIRTLRPRQTLHECYLRSVRGRIAAILESVSEEHRTIAQEIERAREVVRFARQAAGGDQPASALVKEALQNALSLLKYCRDEKGKWGESADTQMAGIFAGVYAENRLLLNRHKLGVVAHLMRHGLRRTSATVLSGGAASLQRGLQRSRSAFAGGFQRFLVHIGWRLARSEGKLEVVTRPFLPLEFTVDLTTKELPALYRHLFRFEPVEDPRFLVGRDRELAAIEEARSFWESRRPAAMIIVGARGSGKTSLINCAIRRCLGGLELIRSEFGRRLTGADEVRQFLAGVIGADDPAGLERLLSERTRVIILEELERIFLRQVGYYGAIRELQRLVAATCTTTLWIIATNEMAFQFLKPAVGLDQIFSHRIYAGTATRDDVRDAIMLRHDLSGLRLNFPPPARPVGGLERLRRKLGDDRDPEAEFFDFLARESGGVFRSAFEIWLGQIEGAQAGILYMKPLKVPDLSPVIDDLAHEDLFTLLAIPQHGGLTAEEHAIIFQKSPAASRAAMDGLLAREIIEPDPGRPGFRVRPEAIRIVREALYRRNLI